MLRLFLAAESGAGTLAALPDDARSEPLDRAMRALVIQGAGMDLRGQVDVDVFGPETLAEINALIEADAASLGVEVEIMQTNDEAEAVRLVHAAVDEFDALLINPSGFTTREGALPEAIAAAGITAIEVHASNPARRGVRSTLAPVCQGSVCGFGYAGYGIALRGLIGR